MNDAFPSSNQVHRSQIVLIGLRCRGERELFSHLEIFTRRSPSASISYQGRNALLDIANNADEPSLNIH